MLYLKHLVRLAAVTLPVALLSACSLMETDRSDCHDGLCVNFKYDYNTERADMFPDHVGEVTLYVFDEADRLVDRQAIVNPEKGRPAPHVSTPCLYHFRAPQPGTYRFVALAVQRPYEETLHGSGAKFRRTVLQPGDSPHDLTTRLDRSNTPVDGRYEVNNENLPLDTVWQGTATRDIRMEIDGSPEQDTLTLSLIRDTKNLTLTLTQLADDAPFAADDYEVMIEDNNGLLRYDNSLDASDDLLRYRPYAVRTTAPDTHRETVADPAMAHYDLSFSRLTYRADDKADARLVIRRRDNGNEVARIDLPYYLAKGREAYAQRAWSEQEYLDREYRYSMHLFLVGDRWQYMDITIGILGWAKRIQRTEL